MRPCKATSNLRNAPKAFVVVNEASMRRLYGTANVQDNSGDHAGSEAKLGVGTRCSLRPDMSIVNNEGPDVPPGSRKNMITRPLGAKVGPSLWKPSVRTRSPVPSGFITPIANLPPDCRVKAM